jgi:phenylacetate-coenzyme A ligase PaaK-like adenylate-forming protein
MAWLRCKKEGRKILPKDLWPLKGLICYGMDTNIYREKLIHYWGKEPLEIYGGTEMGTIATKAWNKKWMTFNPFFCFLEFVPEDEWLKSRDNKDYKPRTLLLNKVEAGKRYEVVLTQLYGMPLLRYRIGDLIKVVALKDEEAGIQTPQIVFDCRADDLIDIGGFTRIDENTIWQAIANTGVKYEDWSIRKEYEQNKPVLKLYVELKQEMDALELEKLIQQQLVNIYPDYRDLEGMLGIRPLKVTLLPEGSFQQYYDTKKAAGADLAHLKPPHMNASDIMIEDLLVLTRRA